MNPIDTNRKPDIIKKQCIEYIAGVTTALKLKLKSKNTTLTEDEKKELLEAEVNYPPAPKYFRDIYLDIPKQTISRWKTGTKEQLEMWDLIHTAVHKINAVLEVTLLNTIDNAKARSILAVLSAWDMDRYNTKVITAKISRQADMERIALQQSSNETAQQVSIAIPHIDRLELGNEPDATN